MQALGVERHQAIVYVEHRALVVCSMQIVQLIPIRIGMMVTCVAGWSPPPADSRLGSSSCCRFAAYNCLCGSASQCSLSSTTTMCSVVLKGRSTR
eukprot:365059-Chlamydomonas_euryale.AAC.9